jgi:hypothetical protein
MKDPKPTPPPRDRKARRKSSPGQVAFLEYKAVRDKAKAERESVQRQDAWYLHHLHPEKAKAPRAKGVKNNAEQSAWRRQSFVESFADWPSVLPAGEMGERIREWLRDRSVLNPKTGRRKWKWRGCEKHFVKTEVSVRKKLTELKVFRYNFRLRSWFKCGSVEEAETTQRLAYAEEAKRKSAPAGEGWFDEIIGGRLPRGELAKAEQIVLRWCKANNLAEVNAGTVEYFKRRMRQWDYLFRVDNLLMTLESESMAEAVLVAD